MQHNFYANDKAAEDHSFRGGDVTLSYFFTGAKRPYNTVGNIYTFVPVKKSVFKGGWGEIEGVLHLSTFDLNDKSIQGGQFTRITPMVNWYLYKSLAMGTYLWLRDTGQVWFKRACQFLRNPYSAYRLCNSIKLLFMMKAIVSL